MPASAAASWSDERIATLKRLYADGLSASQISAELGGCTRMAVIGKAHRLGLEKRGHKPTAQINPRRRTPAKATSKPKRQVERIAAAGFKHAPAIDDLAIPIEQRRTLLTLDRDLCKWPVGDPATPEFFFCGGEALAGRPYCGPHCRVAYETVDERRRRGRTDRWAEPKAKELAA